MTTYNPAEVERLITWAHHVVASAHPPADDAVATAVYANLRAMADQLEAARAEVERLSGVESDLERITGYHRAKQEECAEIEEALKKSQALRWDMTASRDTARTEADQLRAQNRSLCEALAAAQVKMHAADQRCRTMGEITDEALGLLFGLLTSTGPDRMSINDRRVLIQVAERLQRVQREASK